jgi:hypothetical protein
MVMAPNDPGSPIIPMMTPASPSVLVFDVNETLIDIEAATPNFTPTNIARQPVTWEDRF